MSLAPGSSFAGYRIIRQLGEGGMEGQDVAELINAGPDVLPIGRTIEIITDVAKALDFAHQNGLLHRDVKPANILVALPWTAIAARWRCSPTSVSRGRRRRSTNS